MVDAGLTVLAAAPGPPVARGRASTGMEPGRVLVIRLKSIGDLILSTAFLRALRKALPRAQIHLLTTGVCEPVVRHNPHVDKILLNPEPIAPAVEKARFLQGLRRARYDWVFDLGATPRSAWITRLTGAPVRVGYAFRVRRWAFTHPVPKNRVRKFQSEVVLDLLRSMGLPDDGDATELFLGPGEKTWAGEYFALPEVNDQRLKIGLNPTGSWSSKRWPVEQWRELIRRIHGDLRLKPILFGGPGDEDLVAGIRRGLEDRSLVKPGTTLLQAAAFIRGLDVLIGSDGTPQHIAQALGTRSLTIWGPCWGLGWTKPNDPKHRFIQQFLDCGPCDRLVCPYPEAPGRAPHIHKECMARTTVDTVLYVLKEMLPGTHPSPP